MKTPLTALVLSLTIPSVWSVTHDDVHASTYWTNNSYGNKAWLNALRAEASSENAANAPALAAAGYIEQQSQDFMFSGADPNTIERRNSVLFAVAARSGANNARLTEVGIRPFVAGPDVLAIVPEDGGPQILRGTPLTNFAV